MRKPIHLAAASIAFLFTAAFVAAQPPNDDAEVPAGGELSLPRDLAAETVPEPPPIGPATAIPMATFSDTDAKEPEPAQTPRLLDRNQLAESEDGEGETTGGWPLAELQRIFKGELNLILPDNGDATIAVMVPRRQTQVIGGQQRQMVVYESQAIRRNGGKHTPEQCLAMAKGEVGRRITAVRRSLQNNDDQPGSEQTWDELKFLMRLLFDLDTAFQDFKVTEIEERAKKLRAEVDRRSEAAQQWVNAMITLEEMKANGIAVDEIPTLNPPVPTAAMYPGQPTEIQSGTGFRFPGSPPATGQPTRNLPTRRQQSSRPSSY